MEKNAFTDVLNTKLLAADALGIQELWPSKERVMILGVLFKEAQ